MKFIATSIFVLTVAFSFAQEPQQKKAVQTDSLETKNLHDYGMRLYNPSLCYCPREIDTAFKYMRDSPYKFVNDKDTIKPAGMPENKNAKPSL